MAHWETAGALFALKWQQQLARPGLFAPLAGASVQPGLTIACPRRTCRGQL